jgi:GNAT superfamily N-acetyltransferase
MDIHEIDVHDDDVFHRFYEILAAADRFERPGMPMWSEHEAAVMFRRPEPQEQWTAYAAFDGEEMVGIGFLVLPFADNTNMSWIGVAVAPEQRRRGIGSALVDHFVKLTADAGRDVVLADSSIDFARRDDHPYRRFAEKHGFALANVEIRRILELPIPESQLQAWADDAAPHHSEYRLETFVNDVPDELLESYCYLLNQLIVDTPTGDIDFEPMAITPEAFKERVAKTKEQGRTVYTTVAIDASGEAVAHTVLAVPSGDEPNIHQWATLVRADHRGHRLGFACKVRNLRAVQAAHPDRTRVFTCNAETNEAMVGINELMGFKPVEVLAEFQRKL